MASGRTALRPEVVIRAVKEAADMLSGMGYHGKAGSVHLLDLHLQNNTVTAILHNMVAWRIGELDKTWTFHPKGGATPDLTGPMGEGIEVKATSNHQVKGNRVSKNAGYYVVVKYTRAKGSREVVIREVLLGELESSDWLRPEGTQWAMLTPYGEKKLKRIYPEG